MTYADAARDYIATMPHAIAGSRGHDCFFKVACVLRKGFAFSAALTEQLLSEWNKSHCDPPFSDAEVKRKAKQASGSTIPEGSMLHLIEPKGDEDDVEKKRNLRAKWPSLKPLLPAGIQMIANLRRLPVEAVKTASDAGIVRGGMVDSHRCFVFREATFAQALRLDGGTFEIKDRDTGEISHVSKKTLPGSEQKQVGFIGLPLVKASTGPVLLVEGCVGILEALAAIFITGADTYGWTAGAAISAGSSLNAEWLDILKGRRVRIIPDNNRAGIRACGRWFGQLEAVGAKVDAVRLDDADKDLGPLVAANSPKLTDLFPV